MSEYVYYYIRALALIKYTLIYFICLLKTHYLLLYNIREYLNVFVYIL